MTNRELDALVAEKVMGLEEISPQKFRHVYAQYGGPNKTDEWPDNWYITTLTYNSTYEWHRGFGVTFLKRLPCYSTNIAHAWQVVEKISEQREAASNSLGWWQFAIHSIQDGYHAAFWQCDAKQETLVDTIERYAPRS